VSEFEDLQKAYDQFRAEKSRYEGLAIGLPPIYDVDSHTI